MGVEVGPSGVGVASGVAVCASVAVGVTVAGSTVGPGVFVAVSAPGARAGRGAKLPQAMINKPIISALVASSRREVCGRGVSGIGIS